MNRKDEGSSSNNYRIALSTLARSFARGPLASKSSSAPRARSPIWSFRPLTSARAQAGERTPQDGGVVAAPHGTVEIEGDVLRCEY